jgi:hypothetical protein
MQAACRTVVVVVTPTVELTTCPFASVARYSGETTPARVQRDRPTPRWPAPLRSRSLSPWCSRVSLGDASLGPALRPRAELWQRPVSESGRLRHGDGDSEGGNRWVLLFLYPSWDRAPLDVLGEPPVSTLRQRCVSPTS